MRSLFNISDDKRLFKADYSQLLTYFKETPKFKIAETFQKNGGTILGKCLDDRPNFKGGYFGDIFTDVIIETKKNLDVKPVQNLVNKRKRFLSEHDGDYVHERRYDINFMESARLEKVQCNNLIKINACGSFDYNVDASKINDYAKEICELVNFFEAQGRSVELNLTYKLSDLYSSRSSGVMKAFITVKRPDLYLSKADIYRAFSSVFKRHIGFCVNTLMADVNGEYVDEGLGSPLVQNDHFEITDDEINIHGMTFDLVKKIAREQKAKAG